MFNNLQGVGYSVNPFGGNDTAYTEKATALAKTVSTAWINFFVGLDPNGASGLESWPAYEADAGRDVVFGLDGAAVETDDWRKDGINWMIEHGLSIFGN